MAGVKGLSLVLVAGIFLSCPYTLAYELRYSVGPFCENNKVVCKNKNEIPSCFKLEPKVHIEFAHYINGEKKNRYQPACDFSSDSIPKCIDSVKDEIAVPGDVALECVEYLKCQTDKNTNKLVAVCSENKISKCLGGNGNPDCESDPVCGNGSIPVCDYTWQANASTSDYH